MKNELIIYPAIFSHFKDDSEYYTVEFIDLNGCITEGKNLNEAFYMAQDALGLYLEDLSNPPQPTLDISKIKLSENQTISFVSIDINEYRKKYSSRSVRKNLTIPYWLCKMAEKENINFSQVLQEALQEKLNIL